MRLLWLALACEMKMVVALALCMAESVGWRSNLPRTPTRVEMARLTATTTKEARVGKPWGEGVRGERLEVRGWR